MNFCKNFANCAFCPSEGRVHVPQEAFRKVPFQGETKMLKPGNLKNASFAVASLLILFWAARFSVAQDSITQDPDLKLRLKPEQKHNVQIVREDTISQTVMGQKQDIHQTKTTGLEFEVERIDTDGAAWLKVTYLTVKEKSKSAAGQMEYDSTKLDASTDNPFGATYSAMIGQSFVMKIAPKGKIVEIKGIDEMYRRMAEKIVQDEDTLRKKRLKEKAQRAIERANRQYGSRNKRIDAVKKMIKNNPFFTEAKITEAVDNVIIPFSGRALEIGDSWQGKRALLSGVPVKVDCTYTLREKDPAIATVGISSKIDLADVPVSAKVGSSGLTKLSMTGSYQGTAQIDQASGWMIRKKVALKVSGQMKVAANRQAPQGMTIPMSIESVITVESLTAGVAGSP